MKIIKNKPLSKYTTFHLGGNTRYFCVVEDIDDLKEVLKLAEEENVPYFILGGGSNVVVSDEGYDGLVIRIMNQELRIMNEYIEVDAGSNLATVVNESLKNNLIGLEWAYGIPGTIGGAVRGNAGAYGGEIKDSIESIKVLRNGEIIELKNKDCNFGYRESIFKNNKDIILSVKIKLRKSLDFARDQKTREEFLDKIKEERVDKFTGGFSAGSFFKNVLMNEKEIKEFKNKFSELPDQFIEHKKIPAAWFIDQCNLKGFCVGDICVSEKHAGILINKGKGKSGELFQLVSLIKTNVRDKFGIELIEEVCYLI